ncbi:MAG TPA: carboxypeptidase-like regulatory domain-containing protein, partial [Flavisolibacter sp.]|nr:carboxypeptidase-like regulatory domain-containing protein [Flavisolibacter sp.]
MNCKLKELLLLVVSCICMTAGYTQQGRAITGSISNTKGEAVVNATIKVKGTQTTVLSDESGKFTLHASGNKTVLEVSSVGYVFQEVAIGSKTNVSIVLEQEVKKLDEVVVVGYGTQKRRDVTGSIVSVSKDQMNLGGVT